MIDILKTARVNSMEELTAHAAFYCGTGRVFQWTVDSVLHRIDGPSSVWIFPDKVDFYWTLFGLSINADKHEELCSGTDNSMDVALRFIGDAKEKQGLLLDAPRFEMIKTIVAKEGFDTQFLDELVALVKNFGY